ncbi:MULTISPECIES: urease accessory protein UreE [Thiomicrorhabdus]|uniref:Urease accessory protein UreE n=1 Tax=Thiomicrorhabdus heinhorstiae TaxID=2748010 RepID=A0ABS0BYM1_9GAMM|nr:MULTISPECIES: urease accessory protein UreE [Thiomicrorhabdus]MBF6058893.1 urease accessory protein UreE [Thiomicrorhabdus heinhorstiae]
MKEFFKVNPDEGCATDLGTITLDFAQRERSRLRALLDNGDDAGLFLPRGTVLKEGDVLANEEGEFVIVKAAMQSVSTITADSTHLLLRIAYHLGNRHVPLQVEPNWLRYVHDHVLDDMVRGLGGTVTAEQAPFQPETGAYGGGHHHHDNRLAPAHSHSHGHHH